MGRFDYQKGLDRIRQLLSIDWHNHNIRFRLVGKSVIDQRDVKHINHTRIEPAVYNADELIDLLEWADVLLLPSHYEGLPLVVIEAMIAGVVPVVADCGAMRELIEDGVNGLIVSQEFCVEDMTTRLAYLAANADERLKIAESAIASVEDRSWDNAIIDLHERIRREVTSRRASLYCEQGFVADVAKHANDRCFSELDLHLEEDTNGGQVDPARILLPEATG
nr:glycosyltransferase family 4 protein [Methylocystis sp. WRRC1]